jgi:hypothetical protein
MALPSTPTDGCLSATNLVYAGISRGGSSWLTLHTPSSVWTFSSISASWWPAETTDYRTVSRRCQYRTKPPARWPPASRPLPAAHLWTACSPNSRTSHGQPESSATSAKILSTTTGLYVPHRSHADYGDWYRIGSLSQKPSSTPFCGTAQLAASRIPGLRRSTSYPRTTGGTPVAITEPLTPYHSRPLPRPAYP